MMTQRSVFDKVKAHLLAQGVAAKNGSSCEYRADNGLKCAVGCLIPDEAYKPGAESWGMRNLVITDGRWAAQAKRDFNGDTSEHLAQMLIDAGIPATAAMHDLLTHLQQVHDSEDPTFWSAELDEIEYKFFNGVLP